MRTIIKRISFLLAAVLLLCALVSCNKKNGSSDPASMKFAEMYLNVKKIGNSVVKSYASSVPNVRQNPVKSKDVIIHGIAYTMTMTDLEDIVASDGVLLSSRDTYFKAGSADGSSPKIKAQYEYETAALLGFTLDSEAFHEYAESESKLTALFNDVLTSNVPYASAVTPRIVSFVGENADASYKENADLYIVTYSEDLHGHHIGGATLTMTKNGFQFYVNMRDVKGYEGFLEKHTVNNVIDAIRTKLKNQVGEEIAASLKVNESDLIFTLIGSRPCFSFTASVTVGKNQTDFTGYLFIR